MDAKIIREKALQFGADLVGMTKLEKFNGVAPENDPRNIFPQGKSMIMLARRIPRGVLRGIEHAHAPNGAFDDFGLYMLEDQFLTKATYDLVIYMESFGCEAVPMFCYDSEAAAKFPLGCPVAPGKPAPNVYVDWKLAARLCGLGEVGKNGLFITPEFGTLQRFSMLITDVELPAGEIIDRKVCDNCDACQKACTFNNLCSKCTSGAVHTNIGRFNTIDKIAAACGRSCLASLEARGLITRKLTTAFRNEVK